MLDKKHFIIKDHRYRSGKIIKQRYYRAYCDLCGKDRCIYMIEATHKKSKLCPSCRAKKRIATYGNPMLGRKHTNLEKFRPNYPNVNYSDYVVKRDSAGKVKRHYRMSCKLCGRDRGYLKHHEANRICLSCHSNKLRKKTQAQKKLYACLKAGINARCKKRAGTKVTGILRYLPYTIADLQKHLESQFEPWMNWNNHGPYNPDSQIDPSKRTWHIDHVIPDSYFSYESPLDAGFLQSWALSNLRPLESRSNIVKSHHVPDALSPAQLLQVPQDVR